MTWGQITEDGLAAAAKLIGQPLRRSRMQWIETATQDAIRHFAWGIGDDNPLWVDRAYAAASPAAGLIAPPCLLYALDSTIIAPKLPGVQWIYAGTEFTWYNHIRVDTTFRIEAQMTGQEVKSGRRFAKWVLQSGEIRYLDQNGNLIANAVGQVARTPRGTAGSGGTGHGEDAGVHRYTADEIVNIERQILSETRQGDQPLYWEDVEVGTYIPPVVKGPLTTTDILAWYAASQGALHYGGAHGDAVRYRQSHADYHMNPDTGAKDSAGRGHLEVGTGNDVGMGGAYDIGPQRIAWAQHMLTNWIGDHGFLCKLGVSVRKPNLVGDTIWWHGTVTTKREIGAAKLVDLSVTAVNQKNVQSAIGTAPVVLPSRTKGPVPLPLSQATIGQG